jgi:hypothetical protein
MTTPTSSDLLNQAPLDPDATAASPETSAPKIPGAQQRLLDQLNALSAGNPPAGEDRQPEATQERPSMSDPGVAANIAALPAVVDIDKKIAATQGALSLLEASPLEKYRELLRINKIDPKVAVEIVDCMLLRMKPFRRTYSLWGGRVVITLRTRSPGDQRKINAELDRADYKLATAYETHMSLLHIAFSLVSYKTSEGEHTFAHDAEDGEAAWVKAMAFISNLPSPTVVKLQDKVYEFERMVSLVMSEGYEENF